MAPVFHRKLSLAAAFSAFLCTAAAGAIAYWLAGQSLTAQARSEASRTAVLLAARAGDELKSLADRSRYYVSTGQQKSFETDGELLALSVLRKPSSETEAEDWVPHLRWMLPESDPSHLGASDFQEIELKHPVDYDRIAEGQADVVFGAAKNQSAFLRLAIPYGERSAEGYTQAIVAEVKMRRFQALFSEARDLFAFMTGSWSQLVIASDAEHFETAEDLAQLPLQLAARKAPEAHGALDYSETPEGETQHASFQRVPFGTGITIFAQVPHSRIAASLDTLVQKLAAVAFAMAVFFGIVMWRASLRSVGARLHELDDALEKAQTAVPAYSKVQDPELRARFESGQVRLSGERVEAAVLHVHLHGLERLASEADPERLLQLLNEFHQKTSQAVESRQGIIDHMHGGSVVAFWGVPKAERPDEGQDVRNAIDAASAIRDAAKRFNRSIERDGFKPAALGMGLHHGPVTAGQVGTPERLEYSAVGEAIEIAGRIRQFTDQFGTDFLMTGAAAAKVADTVPSERVTSGDESSPELFELASGMREPGSEAA
jgi:class 3 adenylate cyclase